MTVKCIFNLAEEVSYKDGEIIFKEGSQGDWVYFILSGTVEIYKTFEGRKYSVDLLKPGEVFGELAFIGASKRSFTARAVGNTTVGVIDNRLQEREFNQLSAQFRNVLETIIKRSEGVLERACAFQSKTELRFPKGLSIAYKNREAFLKAFTPNADMGGLFVKAENPLSPGHKFQLKLSIPGISNPLQIKCEVIWARKREKNLPDMKPGMGIKFIEMSEKNKDLLRRYIASSNMGS
jgi:uncharacterized protein (TIGR02266 family)